jgi:hypothetical protein
MGPVGFTIIRYDNSQKRELEPATKVGNAATVADFMKREAETFLSLYQQLDLADCGMMGGSFSPSIHGRTQTYTTFFRYHWGRPVHCFATSTSENLYLPVGIDDGPGGCIFESDKHVDCIDLNNKISTQVLLSMLAREMLKVQKVLVYARLVDLNLAGNRLRRWVVVDRELSVPI